MERIDTANTIKKAIEGLESGQQLSLIGKVFSSITDSRGISVPTDYLHYSLAAMQNLMENGRHNVLYGLARGLGTVREEGGDSIFPCKKVVTGLIEYSVDFFNSGSNAQHVRCFINHTLSSCI